MKKPNLIVSAIVLVLVTTTVGRAGLTQPKGYIVAWGYDYYNISIQNRNPTSILRSV